MYNGKNRVAIVKANKEVVKTDKANNNVARLRKRLSLTQDDFSERAGFSVDTLRKIEQGNQKVTLDKALRIADTYGVSLDWIFGRTEDTTDTASSMLLYLKKLFDYHIDENYDPPYVLEISQPILTFLADYRQAESLFECGKIPEAAFLPWIEKLKGDLNRALKDGTFESADYCLIPKAKASRKDAPTIRVNLGGPLGGTFNG